MQEENIQFESGSSFYNPHMKLCRSISSLAVGAIEGEIEICDGFSSTGIRGIRYAKENPNVSHVSFVEFDKNAAALCRKNISSNSVKGELFEEDFNHHLMGRSYNLVELDPFGSPAPYSHFAIRSFRRMKSGYVSATATDTAVLCGAHHAACLKYYHSRPLHNELCHEAGARILLKHFAGLASEFDFGMVPLFTLSHRHFFKIFLRLEKGAEKAVNNEKSIGYINFCPKCLWMEGAPIPKEKCPRCKSRTEYGGPLWLGNLHSKEHVMKMAKLNEERSYRDKAEIGKLLSLMHAEDDFPPYFFDVHRSCRRFGLRNPKPIEEIIAALKKRKYSASRTHFSPTGIRTDAPASVFRKLISSK
ncbi:MAG: tRNA (guanine(10)-N(2))-dimethyltransferase [Candidatus Micrarchaeota archaeon]